MGTNKKVTVAIFSFKSDITGRIISELDEIEVIDKIVVISKTQFGNKAICLIKSDYPFSSEAIKKVIEETITPYLLLINGSTYIELTKEAVNNFISQADKTEGGWIYSDYYEKLNDKLVLHPLIDYQIGSVRDDFDFGNCFMVRAEVAKDSLLNLYSMSH